MLPYSMESLDVLDKFINIAKELAKLPALVLPQYQSTANDIYEICRKLLIANENLSRWLYKFLYFDFRHADARTNFLETVKEYRTMKQGPEFQQLKFSCGDIGTIYYRNIESKLGNWFSRKAKREEVQGIFAALSDADRDMVAFTYDLVVSKLDNFVDAVEKHVDVGALNDAEELRISTKSELKKVTERLEMFSGELSNLVIQFANIAHVPITLGTP